jgi:uncharacterized protein YraI
VLAPGTQVEVLGEEEDGWVPVRCGNIDGWVAAGYLTVTVGTPEPTAEPAAMEAIVMTNGQPAACRVEPGGAIVASVPNGATVTVRGEANDGWVPVVCDGQDGWITANLLD